MREHGDRRKPYWSRSDVEQIAKYGSQAEIEASLPEQVKVDALMDRSHRDSEKREVVKNLVQKVDNETMLAAQNQLKKVAEKDPTIAAARKFIGED